MEEIINITGARAMKAPNTEELTIRDLFASTALPALITNSSEALGNEAHQDIAKLAYKIADAMMAQRIPPKGDGKS